MKYILCIRVFLNDILILVYGKVKVSIICCLISCCDKRHIRNRFTDTVN